MSAPVEEMINLSMDNLYPAGDLTLDQKASWLAYPAIAD
jgi:hypothetical protein